MLIYVLYLGRYMLMMSIRKCEHYDQRRLMECGSNENSREIFNIILDMISKNTVDWPLFTRTRENKLLS